MKSKTPKIEPELWWAALHKNGEIFLIRRYRRWIEGIAYFHRENEDTIRRVLVCAPPGNDKTMRKMRARFFRQVYAKGSIPGGIIKAYSPSDPPKRRKRK